MRQRVNLIKRILLVNLELVIFYKYHSRSAICILSEMFTILTFSSWPYVWVHSIMDRTRSIRHEELGHWTPLYVIFYRYWISAYKLQRINKSSLLLCVWYCAHNNAVPALRLLQFIVKLKLVVTSSPIVGTPVIICTRRKFSSSTGLLTSALRHFLTA